MSFFSTLRLDRKANKKNVKGVLVVTAFRFAHLFSSWRKKMPLLWLLAIPYLIIYRLIIEWVLGVELPQKTSVGAGLVIWHGQGLVINDNAILGAHVELRHNTTIGNKENYGPCPIIEDNVKIGAGACILGAVRIGQGAQIGAAAVVIKDVPAGAVVVGNPAKIIFKPANELHESNSSS